MLKVGVEIILFGSPVFIKLPYRFDFLIFQVLQNQTFLFAGVFLKHAAVTLLWVF